MTSSKYGALSTDEGNSNGNGQARLSLSRGPQGARFQLDHWLRSDHSRRNLFRAVATGQYQRSSGLFGPTNRSVEAIVKDRNRAGNDYHSVDRGLIDTAVWHQRKTQLLKSRTIGEDEATEDVVVDDKRFDVVAVSQLQSERLFFDKCIIVFIGIAMACVGLTVSKTADTILDKKLDFALDWFEERGFMAGMGVHVGISALLAFGAFLPVAVCPVSAGSGIAEAKAALNGVIIPNCTALRTALCKGLSVIMSVSASLPAGLEGPMIHLGLCIGANANRLVNANHRVLDPLRSDRSKIDYTAIGTAAGVSAAFRAPISGILFAMEEGASFWSTELTWRCFLSACVTVITMYGILTATHSTFHITSVDLFNGIEWGNEDSTVIPAGFVPEFNLWEYGLFILAGCGGGLIGALFCMANRAIAVTRRKISMGMIQKGFEVVLIATVYASLAWLLPAVSFLSRCGTVADRRIGDGLRQFNCEEGEYNELASLLLNIGGKGITLLFQEDSPEAFSMTTCLAAGFVQLIVLCIAFGMSVSAGIFIPLLFIGACFGRAMGLVLGLDPRTYAIVGAAACLGGVVRVLISLTAIVTSTTSLSFFITPIMLATLSAQTVGNYVSGRPGIYDVILQLRDVPFLEEACPEDARHANVRARNIMKTRLITLGTQVKVGEIVEKLNTHGFSEFPVVDSDEGTLVGVITRVDLCALLHRWDIFYNDDEEETDKTLSFAELDRLRRTYPVPEEKGSIGKHLSPECMGKVLHLSPYIQIAPHTFDGHGSAERAYEMFRCLGLRSLLIVDKRHRPVGVITRHELYLLEEIGHDHHEVEKKIDQAAVYTEKSSLMNQFE